MAISPISWPHISSWPCKSVKKPVLFLDCLSEHPNPDTRSPSSVPGHEQGQWPQPLHNDPKVMMDVDNALLSRDIDYAPLLSFQDCPHLLLSNVDD